jgi:tetratricopeptide (TPR) repeat protein
MTDDEAVAHVDRLLSQAAEHMRGGQYAEGARQLAEASRSASAHRGVVAAIDRAVAQARAFMRQKQAALAWQILEPFADLPHADAGMLALCGHAAMECGRSARAISAFERWSRMAPEDPEASLRLAAALADHGQAERAERLASQVVARHRDSPTAHFVLGRALLEQARFEAAEHAFGTVVRLQPGHRLAQNNLLELAWMRTGDATLATRVLDRTLAANPELVHLRVAKAKLLSSLLQWQEALREIRTGLSVAEDDPELLAAAAQVALQIDGDLAVDYADRLHRLLPSSRTALALLGNAYLAAGKAQLALPIAQSLHQDDANDGQAVAMLADALRMLGDARYRDLLDYGGLVRAGYIDCPRDWPTRDAYLADLLRDLHMLHTLRAHPVTSSLRGGSQAQLDPEHSDYATVRAFPEAIDGPVRRYVAALGHGPDPMRRRVSRSYRLHGMWSVRLRSDGFHLNHYHPAGWISSAFYLALPPAGSMRDGGGWLKFGEPAFPTGLGPEYFVKPEPGLLVLFPSFLWHGTVPFTGDQDSERLTIAFDILPGR